MKITNCLILLALIFSFSNCILYAEENFKEIQSYTPTKFSIGNGTNVGFKYKLSPDKTLVGLRFLEANAYTINVTTYSSYEKQENKITHKIAESELLEVNVSGYEEYLYITFDFAKNDYYYDDYLTIYDAKIPMKLENNKVISINKFLSNQQYEFNYESQNAQKITLFYNTKNYMDNNRSISIENGEETLDIGTVNEYSQTFTVEKGKIFKVSVNNIFIKTLDNDNQKQEFTIMIREIGDAEHNFNEIKINKNEKINYIQSDKAQMFYFYANITGLQNLNTLNFKFDYRYFGKDMIKVLSKIISLDEEIQQKDLDENIPNTNESYASYDMFSDEYYRIYINHSDSLDKKYLYILASVEIQNESYYYGSKSFEYSMGEPEEIFNYTDIDYNKLQTIQKQTIAYIPYYCKLKLNKDDIYLLTTNTYNHFVSTFIKGDLIINNSNYSDILEKNNEVIVLSDMEEFTIKLFGIKKNVTFYVERIKKDEIEYKEDARVKNDIVEFKMVKGETKYFLGTYSYDDYAYGKLNEKYYATSDDGNFEVFFNHNYTSNQESLFPQTNKQNLNEIINLDTHLDFFTIKCTSDGVLYIRPQYKSFDYTVHLIGENEYKLVTMNEQVEVAQLSAPLGKGEETLYFTIMLINSIKSLTANNEGEGELTLNISPDEKGAFESGTIKGNEIFKGKIDLSKYRQDQLGVLLKSTDFGTELEIVEVIHNKYTSYTKLNEGDNEINESYNVYIPIPSDIEKFNITLQKLNGKNISYGIIKSAIDDINYIATADKYINTTSAKIDQEKYDFSVKNDYYQKNDTIKNYTYFILSVLGKQDNLKYNLNINFNSSSEQPTDDPQPSDDPNKNNNDTTKIVIIVVIIVVVVLILVGIILFNVISRRRRSSSEIEKLSSIDSTENQLT